MIETGEIVSPLRCWLAVQHEISMRHRDGARRQMAWSKDVTNAHKFSHPQQKKRVSQHSKTRWRKNGKPQQDVLRLLFCSPVSGNVHLFLGLRKMPLLMHMPHSLLFLVSVHALLHEKCWCGEDGEGQAQAVVDLLVWICPEIKSSFPPTPKAARIYVCTQATSLLIWYQHVFLHSTEGKQQSMPLLHI